MNGRDVAALILATGVSSSVVILCLTVAFQPTTISAQGADLLSSTLGVMIGAVAVYLGYRASDGAEKPTRDRTTDEDSSSS